MESQRNQKFQKIQKSEHLDEIFSALSSPIRRAIIERVSASDCTVNEIFETIKIRLKNHEIPELPDKRTKKMRPITREAISQHLHILIDAQLIEQTKQGRIRQCNLNPKPLSTAFNWLVRYRIFWEQFLDEIQEKVEKNEENNNE